MLLETCAVSTANIHVMRDCTEITTIDKTSKIKSRFSKNLVFWQKQKTKIKTKTNKKKTVGHNELFGLSLFKCCKYVKSTIFMCFLSIIVKIWNYNRKRPFTHNLAHVNVIYDSQHIFFIFGYLQIFLQNLVFFIPPRVTHRKSSQNFCY